MSIQNRKSCNPNFHEIRDERATLSVQYPTMTDEQHRQRCGIGERDSAANHDSELAGFDPAR
jgi:hypothetical protein